MNNLDVNDIIMTKLLYNATLVRSIIDQEKFWVVIMKIESKINS